jgi:chromosome segregation protein
MARALAAQAGEQADVRVAQAALASARQRLDRAEAETARLGRELAALGDDAPLIAQRAEAQAARASAETTLAQVTSALAEAEIRRDAAAQARDAAESAGGAARAALATLEAEARSLVKALEGGATSNRALAKVRAESGYERALAAALGDDLDAAVGGEGPRVWAGAASDVGDPPLATGVERLADRVSAPPELARRLAQIGVVDGDDGTIPLAVGQRLVTSDGRLRRWDGYVARDVGAAAAERLIRVNRLSELEAALPPAARRGRGGGRGDGGGDRCARRSPQSHRSRPRRHCHRRGLIAQGDARRGCSRRRDRASRPPARWPCRASGPRHRRAAGGDIRA